MLNRGQGYPHGARDGDPRQRRPERNRPGDLRGARRAAHRGAAALHRFDGAEQYFTRAVDFGYSFSVEETFEKWGTTGDPRRLRPADPHDPPRRHRRLRVRRRAAAASITRRRAVSRARRSAPRPIRRSIPSRSRRGCGRGSRRSSTTRAGFGGPRPASRASEPAPRAAVSTAARLRRAARQDLQRDRQRGAQHAQVPGHGAAAAAAATPVGRSATLPAARHGAADGADAAGRDVAVRRRRQPRIAGLARSPAPQPPADAHRGLAAIAAAVADARRRHSTPTTTRRRCSRSPTGCTRCARCARELRDDGPGRRQAQLRDRLPPRAEGSASSSRRCCSPTASLEALADDGVVVPGSRCSVNVIVANRGGDVHGEVAASRRCSCAAALTADGGVRCPAAAAAQAAAPRQLRRSGAHCEPTLTIPADARLTEPYWHRDGEAAATRSMPTRRSACRSGRRRSRAAFTLAIGRRRGHDARLPVQYRYEGNIFSGEKRTELLGRAGVLGARVAGDRHRAARRPIDAAEVRHAGGDAARGGAADGRPRDGDQPRQGARRPAAASRWSCPQGWQRHAGDRSRVSFAREDEARRRCDFRADDAAVAELSRPRREPASSTSRRVVAPGTADLRARLSGDRVPAHHAAAHLRRTPTRR